MTPARFVLAVASIALGVTGGCAGPYALPEPLAAPTMAFPSQASSPLPAYATPPSSVGDIGTPVSLTLDGGVAAAPDTTMTAGDGGDGAWLAEWLAADPRAPRDGVFRVDGGQAFDTRGTAARRADGAVAVLPGGGWLRRDGNVYVRSDGSSTVRVGDVFFHSDGSWTRRSGDVLLRSGGGSCRLTVEAAICREGR